MNPFRQNLCMGSGKRQGSARTPLLPSFTSASEVNDTPRFWPDDGEVPMPHLRRIALILFLAPWFCPTVQADTAQRHEAIGHPGSDIQTGAGAELVFAARRSACGG
jgi:hypothetical protein